MIYFYERISKSFRSVDTIIFMFLIYTCVIMVDGALDRTISHIFHNKNDSRLSTLYYILYKSMIVCFDSLKLS